MIHPDAELAIPEYIYVCPSLVVGPSDRVMDLNEDYCLTYLHGKFW
jgi:hypothetical protein